MKVAMRRTVLVAVICFAVALVVSAAFLAWFNADPDAAITAVLASMPLNYLYAVSSGIAAFSAGALVALVAGPLARLRMPKLPRAIFAALGWVVLGFLLLAPIVATAGAGSVAIVFALVGLAWAAINVNSLPMVVEMCKGRMTTDYLSAGSITWQKFSGYLEKIFDLKVEQVAEQTTGWHNTREAVTKCGAPFWVLKYLPADSWKNEELRSAAEKVIDNIQCFIMTQAGDVETVETAMSNVLQLMQGRGRIRVVLATAFQDKNTMAAAFRTYLFGVSPELQDIATKLSIQPEELRDKLHAVMQGTIYTWTEDQVKENGAIRTKMLS